MHEHCRRTVAAIWRFRSTNFIRYWPPPPPLLEKYDIISKAALPDACNIKTSVVYVSSKSSEMTTVIILLLLLLITTYPTNAHIPVIYASLNVVIIFWKIKTHILYADNHIMVLIIFGVLLSYVLIIIG